jgi:hypothetical protein
MPFKIAMNWKNQFNLSLSVAVQHANPICGNLLAMFC